MLNTSGGTPGITTSVIIFSFCLRALSTALVWLSILAFVILGMYLNRVRLTMAQDKANKKRQEEDAKESGEAEEVKGKPITVRREI